MEEIIVSFRNSLTEIMLEKNLTIVGLAKDMGMDPSTLRGWFNSVKDIKLSTLIRLANYFQCSLEYLCGKTHVYKRIENHPYKKFGVRIKEIMTEYDLIPYKFLSDAGVTPSKYYYWLAGGEPMLTAIEAIARYLGITLDKLIGWDK